MWQRDGRDRREFRKEGLASGGRDQLADDRETGEQDDRKQYRHDDASSALHQPGYVDVREPRSTQPRQSQAVEDDEQAGETHGDRRHQRVEESERSERQRRD